MLAMIIAGMGLSWVGSAYAQNQKKREAKETYTRPKPREPIRPEVPSANRYQEDKVFLEHADSLYRPANEFEEFQIVKGAVKFRHGNMWMFCDSAYYYPQKNSMDAFGHVEMRQGDTLFVYSDKLYYDGFEKHATLVRGPSRDKVELKNRTVTLTTDSLDYDLANEIGWYVKGGKLDDKVNTLTSIYGEYSPHTKMAKFRDDVLLVNNRDGYRMITQELDYNTDTHIATINTKTVIEGANDTIQTTQGWYDTTNDHAQLTSRSLITHRDSAMNVTWLEGDSIIYDKSTRTSRAFMFRDARKTQQPMVITDTARKVQLIGGYGEYNDSLKWAFATEYPLLMEFSRPDTLFLRADTVLSFLRTEFVWPDSLNNNLSAAARERLSRFGSLQELADSLPLHLRILPMDLQKPGYGVAQPEETVPETVLETGPETATEEVLNTDTLTVSSDMDSLRADTLELLTGDSIAVIKDSVSSPPDGKADERVESRGEILRLYGGQTKRPGHGLDALGRDSADMVPKEFHVAKAIGRARFFNQDIQGVADTMIYQEYDSMLHLIRKPVVWNEERQVIGNVIDVHFNDSTPDWAYLPQSGMLAEHIDEDFYNQMSGSTMKAYLENKKMKRLEVNGNVQTIFLPQEQDSTYNKLVNAESSYLTIDFADGKIKHLKMWPEVTGTVTPISGVKRTQQYLQGFRWLDALRPRRQWYGDRVRWIDELGEIPDELEQWFREASPVKAAPPRPEDFKGMINNSQTN